VIAIADLRILDVNLLFLLTLISYCIGLKILKLCKVQTDSFLEEIVFSVGLGLGCLSYLVLGLGLLGLLYDWIFYIVFLVLLISSYSELWYFVRRVFVRINTFKLKYTTFYLGYTLFLSLTLVLAIILLLVPTITFDALVYHLAVPETYVKHNKIIYLPYNCFSNYTFNTEMLFTLGLLLKGDLLAKAVHFLFGLLCALSIYTLARRYFNQSTACLSVLAFCSMPLVIFVAVVAFNDLAITFYEILAVYAFINWYKEKTQDWLLVCGLTCGLSIGVKYFGGFCFLILGVSILSIVWYQNGVLKAMKTTIIFAVLALLPNLPWLIKNIIFTGNPVYPLLYNIFGGKNWSQFHHARYIHEMMRYSATDYFLLNPFVFLWDISFKWCGGMDSGVKLPVGPIFIITLPFLLGLRKLEFSIKYLLIFCGVFYLFWSYVCAVDRFSLPCFVLLCVVIAYIIDQFRTNKYLYYCLLSILFLSLSWNLFKISENIYKNSYFMCLKKEGCEKFMLKKSIIQDYYDVISYINHNLPPQSKVLFIGEPRSYYCQKNKLVSTQFDTNIILELIHKSKDIKELMNKLKDLGVTHVLYSEVGTLWLTKYFDYFHWQNDGEKRLYDLFMQDYLRLIYHKGSISLNSLKSTHITQVPTEFKRNWEKIKS